MIATLAAASGRSGGGGVVPSALEYVRIQQPTIAELIVTQNGDIDWTPTLLVGDGSGTWTAPTLPAGASINAASGNITGTLSSLGRTRFPLTYTEGSLSHTIICVQHVVSGVTTISSGAKSAAEVLSTANRHYKLTGNTTFETSAINVSANGIVLDLQGYTLAFDDRAQAVNLTNGNFGTGDTTGWDLTGAAAASTAVVTGTIANSKAFRDNSKSLEIVIPGSTTIYIETSASHSLTSGEFLTLSFWSGQAATNQFDDFVFSMSAGSKNTGSLSGSDWWAVASVFRPGEITSWGFAPATETVPIRLTIQNTNASPRTIYVSEFTATRGLVHGILNRGASSTDAPWMGGGTNTTGFSICNGILTQSSNSAASNTIEGGGTDSTSVDSLVITHKSDLMRADFGRVFAIRGYGATMTNCSVTTTNEKIEDRDNNHGYLVDGIVSGQGGIGIHVCDNTIVGSVLGCIKVDNISGATLPSSVNWNILNTKGRYSNGFGVRAKGVGGLIVQVRHNTIESWEEADDNGRGIFNLSYVDDQFNTVVVASKPQNNEYYGYTLGGAYAWQCEQNPAGVTVAHENFKVVGDGGGACFRYNGPSATSLDISDCTFEVDAATNAPAKNMACIKFGLDSPPPDLNDFTFTDCILKTNHKLFDIASGLTGTVRLIRPHFHIVNDASYVSGSPWYAVAGSAFIQIESPTYEDSFTQTEIETEATADPNVSIV